MIRWINLSACLPTEVAWERNGQGDFTRAALEVLRGSGPTLTNAGFMRRLYQRHANSLEQTPVLDARPGDERRILFGKWYR